MKKRITSIPTVTAEIAATLECLVLDPQSLPITKRVLASELLAGFGIENLWDRSGNTLSPVTANDNVDIGTGVYSGLGANLDYLQLTLSNAETPAEGKIFWDATAGTACLGLSGSGNHLHIGQQDLLKAKNEEGAQVTKGKAVKIKAASSANPSVEYVNNLEANAGCTIAIANETVNNGAHGYFCTKGVVSDFDTSGLTEGEPIYLDSTDGVLTDTLPTNPSLTIKIGICLRAHATEGAIYVNIQSKEFFRDRQVLKEPTGFYDNDNIIVTGNGDRTVTLTGTVEAYYQGVKVDALVSGWTSSAHGVDTTKRYFLYYDGTSFTWSETVWTFDKLQICVAVYDTVNAQWFYLRETHGLMPWTDHLELHDQIGTYKKSGGDLASYVLSSTTAGDRRPTISECVIKDEDLQTILSALTSDLFTLYNLTGAGATSVFAIDNAEIVKLSGNQPYYNQYTGGAWQQTLMTANQHQAIWLVAVPVTADTVSQKYRFMFIQGQSVGTLASQQALSPNSLTLGGFLSSFPEYVFIAKIIIKYVANWTIEEVTSLTGNRFFQTSTTGSFLSSVSVTAPITGSGIASNPLVLDYNTTNLQITASQLNTIQNIDTTATPQFAGLGIGLAGSSGKLLVGTNASTVDFPNATSIFSNYNTGRIQSASIAILGESSAVSGAAYGVHGIGLSQGAIQAIGVYGRGFVNNTADTAYAVGIKGYSGDTHAGGTNIGGYFTALNGATNWAVYCENGTVNIQDLTASKIVTTDASKNLATTLTLDTDGTLTANSDTNIPSQKAVKTYVDNSSSFVQILMLGGM